MSAFLFAEVIILRIKVIIYLCVCVCVVNASETEMHSYVHLSFLLSSFLVIKEVVHLLIFLTEGKMITSSSFHVCGLNTEL